MADSLDKQGQTDRIYSEGMKLNEFGPRSNLTCVFNTWAQVLACVLWSDFQR